MKTFAGLAALSLLLCAAASAQTMFFTTTTDAGTSTGAGDGEQ